MKCDRNWARKLASMLTDTQLEDEIRDCANAEGIALAIDDWREAAYWTAKASVMKVERARRRREARRCPA